LEMQKCITPLRDSVGFELDQADELKYAEAQNGGGGKVNSKQSKEDIRGVGRLQRIFLLTKLDQARTEEDRLEVPERKIRSREKVRKEIHHEWKGEKPLMRSHVNVYEEKQRNT